MKEIKKRMKGSKERKLLVYRGREGNGGGRKRILERKTK